MKIALISIHTGDLFQSMPLGTGSIKAYIHEQDSSVDVTLIHEPLSIDPADIVERLGDYDIIGFSMYVWNRSVFEELYSLVSKKYPSKIIAAGGPEIVPETFFHPDRVIQIQGAGEVGVFKLIQAVNAGAGLRELQLSIATDRSVCLQDLPSPFLSGTIDPSDYQGVLWELSRGCPFKCAFCFESLGSETVERHSLERIEAELRLFVSRGVSQVWVLDPTFNYDIERAKQILELIEAIAPDIYFNFEIRAEYIDAELAALLSRLYCSVQIGLQSSSKQVLKNINRAFNPQGFKENILHLHENHVVYGLDLIYGLPGDSIEGFKKSIAFALDLAPNHLDVFPLSILPGTSLRERAEQYSLRYLRSVPYDLIENPGFDIKSGHNLKLAIDLFYNKGKAVSWFVQLVHALNTTSISIIEKFANFLDEHGQFLEAYKKHGNISKLSLQFLKNEISDHKLYALIADVIQYFTYTSELMESPDKKTDYRIAFYETDIEELLAWLNSGFTDFKKLVKKIKPKQQNMLYWANINDSGVFALSNQLAKKLETLESGRSAVLDASAADAKVLKNLQECGLFLDLKVSQNQQSKQSPSRRFQKDGRQKNGQKRHESKPRGKSGEYKKPR